MVAPPPRTPPLTRPRLPWLLLQTEIVEKVVYRPTRERLPKRRGSQTTSFTVGGAEGYLTAGTYEDGRLGEVFLKFGKQGSTLAGVMDAFSIVTSVALQYGVPLETFVEKFTNMRFEPAGMTDDPDVRMAQSLMDYVFRRLALDYLDFDTRSYMGIHSADERARQLETGLVRRRSTRSRVRTSRRRSSRSARASVPRPRSRSAVPLRRLRPRRPLPRGERGQGARRLVGLVRRRCSLGP